MSRIETAINGWSHASSQGDSSKCDAYSNLCWVLVTSSGEELKEFCSKYWISFDKVPTPLIVLGARLLANRYRDDEELVSQCKNICACYCDPLEEVEVMAGL